MNQLVSETAGVASPADMSAAQAAARAAVCSVVIPVFNEEACLPALFARLLALRESALDSVEFEFLFVDDGSQDSSLPLLLALAAQHAFVRVIGLSRNFGHQMAISAGIDYAQGDWVAVIDADLQDPPELLFDMLQLARQGIDVVYGQRGRRSGETLFKKLSAAAFYRLLSSLCEVEIPLDTGDFRLMSRRVVLVLRQLRERHRFIRGMVPWIGFRSAPLTYARDARFAGETKYPLRKMLKFAANAIFSFSAKPLALATYWGAALLLGGGAGAMLLLAAWWCTSPWFSGTVLMVDVVVLLAGVQSLLLGVQGAYVARLFEEAKGRPLYVIGMQQNLNPDGSN